jgi:hypothetical protein
MSDILSTSLELIKDVQTASRKLDIICSYYLRPRPYSISEDIRARELEDISTHLNIFRSKVNIAFNQLDPEYMYKLAGLSLATIDKYNAFLANYVHIVYPKPVAP